MKTLSATAEKNNTKKKLSRIEAAVEALTAAAKSAGVRNHHISHSKIISDK